MNYEREREEEVWKKVIWKIKIKWRKHNKIKQKRKTDEEKKTQRATKPHTHRIINKIHSKGRVVNTLCACYIFLGCCSCCCCWCWVLCFFFCFLIGCIYFFSLSLFHPLSQRYADIQFKFINVSYRLHLKRSLFEW